MRQEAGRTKATLTVASFLGAIRLQELLSFHLLEVLCQVPVLALAHFVGFVDFGLHFAVFQRALILRNS